MKQTSLLNLEKLKEQIITISDLTKQLEQMRKETLASLKEEKGFEESRKQAYENVRNSPDRVRDEINFMKEVMNLFDDTFLDEESNNDTLRRWAILNEHKYYKDWLDNPELEEATIDAETLKILNSDICDLGFSTRLKNCIRCNDIRYVFQLVDINPTSLLDGRNMGKISLKQLTDKIYSVGLDFEYRIRYSEETKLYYTLRKK